jgi:predicted O-methyltransferase YrrM
MRVLNHFILWSLGLAKAQTWPAQPQAYFDFLQRHVQGRRRVAEIGCWQGVTTAHLLRQMAVDGILFAVDPYEPGQLGLNFPSIMARSTVGKVRRAKVVWVRKTEVEGAQWLKDQQEAPLDFVLVDHRPNREGIQAAWENWSSLMASQGIMIISGSRCEIPEHEGYRSAAEYCDRVSRADARFELVDEYDRFTVFRRR